MAVKGGGEVEVEAGEERVREYFANEKALKSRDHYGRGRHTRSTRYRKQEFQIPCPHLSICIPDLCIRMIYLHR